MSEKMQNTIKDRWPDQVRLDMIENSEWYESPSVYQYGFYDGYQRAKKETKQNTMSLENVQEMLIDFANSRVANTNYFSGLDRRGDTMEFLKEWRKNNDC